MKCSAQAALALGVGYMLGRRRKMRLATMLAVGAATGGAARLGPAAVKQGAKYLGKADIGGALGPQVAEIVDTVRGDLLDAAKAAAAAAVTSRIDALSDSLHERAEMLRYPEPAVGKADEAADETAGRASETVRGAGGSLGKVRRRGREAEPEEEEAEFGQDEEPEEEERSKGRVRRGRPPVRRGARSQSDEAEEPEDAYEDEDEDEEWAEADGYDEEEEPEEEPPPRRRRAARSPVTRTRR
jgi:hypothetical protein